MKNKPYFVWLSLALMTLGAFVYWQKGAASAQHKVLLGPDDLRPDREARVGE